MLSVITFSVTALRAATPGVAAPGCATLDVIASGPSACSVADREARRVRDPHTVRRARQGKIEKDAAFAVSAGKRLREALRNGGAGQGIAGDRNSPGKSRNIENVEAPRQTGEHDAVVDGLCR